MKDTAPPSFSISALNRAADSQAAAMMDRVVERSPWFAHRAAAARPFRDADHLAAWLEAEVRHLSHDEAVQLLCAHPELSPSDPTGMTHASQDEQGRLRLLQPNPQLSERLFNLNRRYLRQHGYPFIIALHAQADTSAVIAQFENRIAADPDEELVRALGEVVSVMQARLAKLAGTAPKMGGSSDNTCTPVANNGRAGT